MPFGLRRAISPSVLELTVPGTPLIVTGTVSVECVRSSAPGVVGKFSDVV